MFAAKNIFIFLLLFTNVVFSQSLDSEFSQKKMREDLQVFKNIRNQSNSGLYKYRTKQQTDSIYNWAENQINNSSSYRDFFNIICNITDFEGSLHNDTDLPKNILKSLREETNGYFPYPIKWINGKWIVNFENEEIPLGSEIITINEEAIQNIIEDLYKYYTTDGFNLTGKRIGLNTHFSKYYRFNYGSVNYFTVEFKELSSDIIQSKTIKSVGYSEYYKNFRNRFSKPFDQNYYEDLTENQKYNFNKIDSSIAILTINTFAMGNETTEEHKKYKAFLDSTFIEIKNQKIANLIVDVRINGGGTDPNDILTYSYLTNRNFQENKKAWISFKKIPFLRYYNIKTPKFIRPLVVRKYNKELREIFPEEIDGKFYQNEQSDDHKIWNPNTNAFQGNIYLLVNPAVASAGSLFASMVAGNHNTTVIGEETMGGYFGHNGHTPFEYKLPNSKFITTFSIVNLEQDVAKRKNQIFGRGIIPDYEVSQTFDDYLKHCDTQLNFTIELIHEQK